MDSGAGPGAAGVLLRFGPYELIDRIAKSDVSDVYAAHMLVDEGTRPVALKRFDPAFSAEEGFTRIMLEEAQMASRLRHPNIAAVYDYGIIDRSCYVANELIDGVDVGYVVEEMAKRGEPIPPEFALHICIAVCGALAYAHRGRNPDAPLGQVHRDVSPRNIMVTFAGVVKLTDFGVVRARRYLRDLITELRREECGYLSPEEVQGSSVDGRSDVFSLATVLHELLTGVALFGGGSAVSTVQRVLHSDIQPPSRANPELAPRLDQILLRALSRDLTTRYQSAESFGSDLQRYAVETSLVVTTQDLRQWLCSHFAERSSFGLIRRLVSREHPLIAGAFDDAFPLDDDATDTDIDSLPAALAAGRLRQTRPTLSVDDELSTTRKQRKQLHQYSDEFDRSTVRNIKMASQPVRDDSAVSGVASREQMHASAPGGDVETDADEPDTVVARSPFSDLAEAAAEDTLTASVPGDDTLTDDTVPETEETTTDRAPAPVAGHPRAMGAELTARESGATPIERNLSAADPRQRGGLGRRATAPGYDPEPSVYRPAGSRIETDPRAQSSRSEPPIGEPIIVSERSTNAGSRAGHKRPGSDRAPTDDASLFEKLPDTPINVVSTDARFEDEVPTTHRRRTPGHGSSAYSPAEALDGGASAEFRDLETSPGEATNPLEGSTAESAPLEAEPADTNVWVSQSAETERREKQGAAPEPKRSQPAEPEVRLWRWLGLVLILAMLAGGAIGAYFLAKANMRKANQQAPVDQLIAK
jgi:serine/threonine protein kinase